MHTTVTDPVAVGMFRQWLQMNRGRQSERRRATRRDLSSSRSCSAVAISRGQKLTPNLRKASSRSAIVLLLALSVALAIGCCCSEEACGHRALLAAWVEELATHGGGLNDGAVEEEPAALV